MNKNTNSLQEISQMGKLNLSLFVNFEKAISTAEFNTRYALNPNYEMLSEKDGLQLIAKLKQEIQKGKEEGDIEKGGAGSGPKMVGKFSKGQMAVKRYYSEHFNDKHTIIPMRDDERVTSIKVGDTDGKNHHHIGTYKDGSGHFMMTHSGNILNKKSTDSSSPWNHSGKGGYTMRGHEVSGVLNRYGFKKAEDEIDIEKGINETINKKVPTSLATVGRHIENAHPNDPVALHARKYVNHYDFRSAHAALKSLPEKHQKDIISKYDSHMASKGTIQKGGLGSGPKRGGLSHKVFNSPAIKNYEGDFGYVNHEQRSVANDKHLEKHLTKHGLNHREIGAFMVSGHGRHVGDNYSFDHKNVEKNLPHYVSKFKADVKKFGLGEYEKGMEVDFEKGMSGEALKVGQVHRIDWDGDSKVKIHKITGNTVHYHRIDSQGERMPGEEHQHFASTKQFHSFKLKKAILTDFQKAQIIAKNLERVVFVSKHTGENVVCYALNKAWEEEIEKGMPGEFKGEWHDKNTGGYTPEFKAHRKQVLAHANANPHEYTADHMSGGGDSYLTLKHKSGVEHTFQYNNAKHLVRKFNEKKAAMAGTNTIEKGGEGSKGGTVIGHTKTGKPVYGHLNASAPEYKHFKIVKHLNDHLYNREKKAGRIEKGLDEADLVKAYDKEFTINKEQVKAHLDSGHKVTVNQPHSPALALTKHKSGHYAFHFDGDAKRVHPKHFESSLNDIHHESNTYYAQKKIAKNPIQKSQSTDLEKGQLAYDLRSINAGDLSFSKTGKEIKAKMVELKATCDANKTVLKAAMTTSQTAAGEAPTEPLSDYHYGKHRAKIGELNRYEWKKTYSDSPISGSSSEPTAEQLAMREYNNQVDQYVSTCQDCCLLDTLISNLDEKKTYKLTVEQLSSLGF